MVPTTPSTTTSAGRPGGGGPHPDGPVPVESLSYEGAREELVAVVSRLEAGGETLEGSLALWERGEALAERCQQWLDGARRRLDAARSGDDSPDSGAPGHDPASARQPAGAPSGPDEDEDNR